MTAATSDTTTSTETTEEVDTAAAEGAESTNADDTQDGKDWEAEFKAQQKVNRDLERRSKARMKELEAELAAAKTPMPAENATPDLDAIRKQIRDETQTEVLRERALDKLEAKAARTFQNPEDARTFLAARVDDFIDGATVDAQAISDALADLLTERPYLGVTQGEPKRFQGSADGGARGTAGKPQLTESDVKRLSAEGKHAEIEAARLDGRLNTLLGIT